MSDSLARQPALAHWIDRAVESGQVASYGEVARVLGLTESRITQVTALLGLSPAMPERVLLGEGGIGIQEAIRMGRGATWGDHQASAHQPFNGADPIGPCSGWDPAGGRSCYIGFRR